MCANIARERERERERESSGYVTPASLRVRSNARAKQCTDLELGLGSESVLNESLNSARMLSHPTDKKKHSLPGPPTPPTPLIRRIRIHKPQTMV